jgi:hypothetical protein
VVEGRGMGKTKDVVVEGKKEWKGYDAVILWMMMMVGAQL